MEQLHTSALRAVNRSLVRTRLSDTVKFMVVGQVCSKEKAGHAWAALNPSQSAREQSHAHGARKRT